MANDLSRVENPMLEWYERIQSRLTFPYETLSVSTRFGRTHVLAAGEEGSPPAVLVQGLGGNALLWEPQLRALSGCFRVYALDVIGQMGKSAHTWLPYGDDSYSAWLLDILEGLKISAADFVGISFGARIVMRFAAFAPRKVRRLALLSPVGLAMLRWKIIWEILPMGINLVRPRDEHIHEMVHRVFDVPGRSMDPDCEEALQIILKHYRPVSGIRKTVDGMTLFFPLTASELRRVTMPVLLMAGENERLCVPRVILARGKRCFPDLWKAEIVPEAGHIMNYDRPEHVNRRLLEFFSAEE